MGKSRGERRVIFSSSGAMRTTDPRLRLPRDSEGKFMRARKKLFRPPALWSVAVRPEWAAKAADTHFGDVFKVFISAKGFV
ncbi:hypothetical protein KSP39_PZI023315 [Platanthera zijinensis]|uniref:Uncharacterized protein n=1 Tax=Platanthera zijinensis TaxID=2320716 RepID=A0AAP0FV65_9ASPA